ARAEGVKDAPGGRAAARWPQAILDPLRPSGRLAGKAVKGAGAAWSRGLRRPLHHPPPCGLRMVPLPIAPRRGGERGAVSPPHLWGGGSPRGGEPEGAAQAAENCSANVPAAPSSALHRP